jgi:acetoin utilization deacetylase AcuC-like enzyme
MRKIGFEITSLNLPMLVVQEGGYSLRNLKTGSVAFFRGVAGALGYTHKYPSELKERKR